MLLLSQIERARVQLQFAGPPDRACYSQATVGEKMATKKERAFALVDYL